MDEKAVKELANQVGAPDLDDNVVRAWVERSIAGNRQLIKEKQAEFWLYRKMRKDNLMKQVAEELETIRSGLRILEEEMAAGEEGCIKDGEGQQ